MTFTLKGLKTIIYNNNQYEAACGILSLLDIFNSIVHIKDLITKVITARKRSLGKGNVFTRLSFCSWEGSLYDVTSCLAAWSHVPSGVGVSVSGPMFLLGGLRETPGQRPPPLPRTLKSGQYTYYWNAFLFEVETTQLLFS